MAENETKKVEKKAKKPNVFSRFAARLRSCKAELKKVVWASPKTVKTNTILVLVVMIVVAAVIGLVDLIFSQGIVLLSELI